MNTHTAELIAACHKATLPQTTSSKAGVSVLKSLYKILLDDPHSKVAFALSSDGKFCVGFSSGTINYSRTQSLIKRLLPKSDLLKLAFQIVLDPRHILAGLSWNALLPAENAGYILTIGVDKTRGLPENSISGSRLLEELEIYFRENKCREVWVDTEATNTRALQFYLKHGYEMKKRCFAQVLLYKPLIK